MSTTATFSSAAAPLPITIGRVHSTDGTPIGYRQLGRGPALILLHGAMESSLSHLQLAQALADSFTVYLPDRRGRGLSGAYRPDHTPATDLADFDAVLAVSGARLIAGVSSGAIVCLEAALARPAIAKAVIFEPPLSIHGSVSTAFLARYDREIAEGRVVAALTSAMLGAHMGPPLFQRLPRWLLEAMTQLMTAAEEKNAAADTVTMRALAPTVHYDFQLVQAITNAPERYRPLPADVLLLGGSQSPAYLKMALAALEQTLPHVRRIELPNVGHGATGNTDRGGQPALVAPILRQFLTAAA